MKQVIKPFITVLVVLALLAGCNNKNSKIPFDPKKAAEHVIPYDSVKAYRNSFEAGKKELASLVKDSAFLNGKFNMPVAEMFNRDAIIALLDAPDAAFVRIYFGRKANGEVVMVLVPANSKGNDINTVLVPSNKDKALKIPGISSAYAQEGGGQGMEDGQRCPTRCSEY